MAAGGQIMYPITLDKAGRLVCDLRKLKDHLIQELNYNQTDVSRLVTELSQLLAIIDSRGVLRAAAENNNTELFKLILQSVNPEERLHFIQEQAGGFDGLLVIAYRYLESYRIIFQSISSDERLQLLLMKDSDSDSDGYTILHYLPAGYNTERVERVEMILESVSEEERYVLLSAQNNDMMTPVHYVCGYGNTEVLELMMRLITTEDTRYKLLQIPGYKGLTPLHMSALGG
jgi:ankyrin repeat protein